jgi:hypothetical protein
MFEATHVAYVLASFGVPEGVPVNSCVSPVALEVTGRLAAIPAATIAEAVDWIIV